jgi:hypothetical protein
MTRLQTGKRPRLRLRLTTMPVWPGRGLGFWASVLRHMKTRGLDPHDREAVRRICGEFERSRPAPRRRGPLGNIKRSGGG